MKTLKLKLVNAEKMRVQVDGKDAKIKKERGYYYLTHETENSTARITVTTPLRDNGKLWLLSSIFYFIISLFGLFDPNPNPKCRCVKFDGTFYLSGEMNAGTLRFQRWRKGEKCVVIDGFDYTTASENENYCYIDEQAVKRKKKMRVVKILTTVAIAIIAVLIVLL